MGLTFIGKSKHQNADQRTQKDDFRRDLMKALVPGGSLHRVMKLFGSHYGFTSMAFRAMGGTAGKRIYWPGTAPSVQDFDLVDIGNDVVFGSRSHIVTTDSLGSSPVKAQHGAMIADRVVLSPGTTVGSRSILGSGALTRRGQTCDEDTVWVGSKNGGAICFSSNTKPTKQSSASSSYFIFADETSKEAISKSSSAGETVISTPFGRAFYEHKAPYHVLGQGTIFLYSTFITIFVQLYWNTGTVSTVILSNIIKRAPLFHPRLYRPLLIYTFSVAILSSLIAILSLV